MEELITSRPGIIKVEIATCDTTELDAPIRHGPGMAMQTQIHYVSDADGKFVSVIVPIELWREIESERETAYLLKSDAMRKRLLEAIARSSNNSQ